MAVSAVVFHMVEQLKMKLEQMNVSGKIITDLEGHAKVFDFTSCGQWVKSLCDQIYNSNGE